jgi:hypothetical protein
VTTHVLGDAKPRTSDSCPTGGELSRLVSSAELVHALMRRGREPRNANRLEHVSAGPAADDAVLVPHRQHVDVSDIQAAARRYAPGRRSGISKRTRGG